MKPVRYEGHVYATADNLVMDRRERCRFCFEYATMLDTDNEPICKIHASGACPFESVVSVRSVRVIR